MSDRISIDRRPRQARAESASGNIANNSKVEMVDLDITLSFHIVGRKLQADHQSQQFGH